MTTVAVTGAAGHVGVNLIRALLDRGQKVRALIHHNRRGIEGLDIEIVQGDVTDLAFLKRFFSGVEVVYHSAAYISITSYEREILEAVNNQGTRNVVKACLECGIQRLVHFSSIDALVDKPLNLPVDEKRPLVESKHDPPYALSKASGERHVLEGLTLGLDAVILYPTAIIGPHDYRLGYPNTGLLSISNGELLALVDGGYDWVDVRDVVEGAIKAATSAPTGKKYIMSGSWVSLLDLAKMIERICDVQAPRFISPMWLARLGAPFMTNFSRLTGKKPLYTSVALRPLRGNRRISHNNANRDLDYHPRPLQETVVDTLKWFEMEGLLTRKLLLPSPTGK